MLRTPDSGPCLGDFPPLQPLSFWWQHCILPASGQGSWPRQIASAHLAWLLHHLLHHTRFFICQMMELGQLLQHDHVCKDHGQLASDITVLTGHALCMPTNKGLIMSGLPGLELINNSGLLVLGHRDRGYDGCRRPATSVCHSSTRDSANNIDAMLYKGSCRVAACEPTSSKLRQGAYQSDISFSACPLRQYSAACHSTQLTRLSAHPRRFPGRQSAQRTHCRQVYAIPRIQE